MTSLDNLDYTSEQEVFNYVAAHLLTQNQRAEMNHPDSGEVCAYRSGQLKCAVGCLISDEDYLPEMEGRNVYHIIDDVRYKKVFQKMSGISILIGSLQRIHDSYEPSQWRRELLSMAERRGLNSTSIQNITNV